LSVRDLKPTTPEDADSLTDSLRKLALPRQRLSAPMVVVSGSNDHLVLPSWVAFAVARSCEMGGQIQYWEQEGAGHGQVGTDERVLRWMTDRFAGRPAPTNCPAA
jgi:hypothetical protein